MGLRTAASAMVMAAVMQAVQRRSPEKARRLALWWEHQCRLRPNWCGRFSDVVVAPTRGGLVACHPLDDWLEWHLMLHGEWEPTISDTIERALRPGDVFLDVGAHTGFHALLGAQTVGPTGEVIVVEPYPRSMSRLIGNFQLNNLKNMTPLSLALGDGPSMLRIYAGPNGEPTMLSCVPSGHPIFAAPLARIDQVLPAEVLDRVRLIKVDVEGAEYTVLSNMDAMLDRPVPPMLIVEITDQFLRGAGASEEKLMTMLRGKGYEIYATRRQAHEPWSLLPEGKTYPEWQYDAFFVPASLPDKKDLFAKLKFCDLPSEIPDATTAPPV